MRVCSDLTSVEGAGEPALLYNEMLQVGYSLSGTSSLVQ